MRDRVTRCYTKVPYVFFAERSEMVATGIEAAVVKQALSAVSRIASPFFGNTVKRIKQQRRARKVVAQVDRYFTDVPELTPGEASALLKYVESRDFEVISIQIAISSYNQLANVRTGAADFATTGQLREGLRKTTGIEGGKLRQIHTVLEKSISREIANLIESEIVNDARPVKLSARMIENISDQSAASVRNSALLEEIADLAAIHEFEKELKGQIRVLKEQMYLANAGTVKYVAYEKLYVERILTIQREALWSDGKKLETSEDVLSIARTVILGDPGGGKSTLVGK